MKISARPSGPFSSSVYYEASEIDEMCAEALEKGGRMPSEPKAIDIELFVEKYFSCNVAYEDLPDGYMGYSAFNKKGKVVTVGVSSKLDTGTRSSERRVRSTWAHEAGHCLLHAMLFVQESGQQRFGGSAINQHSDPEPRILCRDDDVSPGESSKPRYDGRWWEWQANRAIGGFLLPKQLVLRAVNELVHSSLVTSTPLLPESKRAEAEMHLADIFDVNPAVARIRLTEMFPRSNGQMTF